MRCKEAHLFPVPNFDPIEVVRGIVASLGVTAEKTVGEIHIGRIRESFSRTGLATRDMRRSLDGIRTLGEVEHIGNGYWLATPTRAVPLCDHTALLISVAPTTELRRHFSTVRRSGLGRIVSTGQVNSLLLQPLNSWCRFSDLDAASWAENVITSSSGNFGASLAPVDLEVFTVKSIHVANSHRQNVPAWIPVNNRHVSAWNGVNLFRTRVGLHKYRYFLAKQARNSAFLEGPLVLDNLRMQYGLAALLGKPLTILISQQVNATRVRLPLIAPRSVRRLLAALCNDCPESFGCVWQCQQLECWPVVNATIKSLSCKIANYE